MLLVACEPPPPPPAPPTTQTRPAPPPRVNPQVQRMFAALPERVPSTGQPCSLAQIDEGRALFFDPRLSGSGALSCNSCHPLDAAGASARPAGRDAPSIFNAAVQTSQGWDGRSADVESHVLWALRSPAELGGAGRLPDGREDGEISAAIGCYVRGLLTPSRFDDYIAGDATALTDAEQAGLSAFLSAGCVTCHGGVGVGGGMFSRLVLPDEGEDVGREALTGLQADRGFFKVPSLRNVTATAPYLHDGSISSLDEAIRLMDTHQPGRALSDDAIASVAVFLGALEGEADAAYITPP